MFFDQTQTHFWPTVAKVKISSEEGQKHIYAQEHQLYYYYNNFKGQLQHKNNTQTEDSQIVLLF